MPKQDNSQPMTADRRTLIRVDQDIDSVGNGETVIGVQIAELTGDVIIKSDSITSKRDAANRDTFINAANNSFLLERVGGGYRFYHQYVQECFAKQNQGSMR